MKIVILMKSYDTMYFFKAIADKLKANQITVIHSDHSECYGGAYNVTRRAWQHFDTKLIDDINPDVILVWNGYQFGSSASIILLKKKYRVLHVEMGWLPQNKFLYIAEGLGPDSNITSTLQIKSSFTENETAALIHLRNEYAPTSLGENFRKRYIFVPLQMVGDTAITMFSPYFKTMESLIWYVKRTCPGYDIIVKPHPKEAVSIQIEGVTFMSGISANDLSAHAYAVIGINSTALIEAMIHRKPVLNFGHNVIMRALPLESNVELIAEPDHVIDSKLLHLLKNQVNFLDPQPWVIDYIIG